MACLYKIYNKYSEIRLLVLLLILLLAKASPAHSAQTASQTASLAWNADSDTSVVGYRIYYGTATGQYTQEVEAGSATSLNVGGLTVGSTYYIVVTAYNADGVESLPSTEVSYTVPAADSTVPPPGIINSLQLLPNGTMQVVFTLGAGAQPNGTGSSQSSPPASFQTVDVQFSNDLVNWSVLETVPYGSGTVTFVDNGSVGVPRRFYRLVFH